MKTNPYPYEEVTKEQWDTKKALEEQIQNNIWHTQWNCHQDDSRCEKCGHGFWG